MEGRSIPAGLLGRYYASRHSYGHYRSCAGTGVYKFPSQDLSGSRKDFTELLKFSLAKTIERHPILCYGITEKCENSEAQFVHLRSIHWDDVVEMRCSESENEDVALSAELEIGHQHLFKDQYQKPAWKLIVLIHKNGALKTNSRVDIAFVSHHAVADGTSCVAFHKTILEHFYLASSQPGRRYSWPYIVPEKIPKPSFIEESFPLPPAAGIPATNGSIIYDEPPLNACWTASPPFLKSIDDYRSRIHLITIPSSQVPNILKTCRRLTITVTGLLHSLILTYLSKAVTDAQGFRAVTPYSMRRFTKTSDEEMVNHVSYVTHDWKEPLLSSVHGSGEQSEEEEEAFRKIAKQFQTQIAEELAAVPERGPFGPVEISKIGDFDQFCEEGMKGKRRFTYELSNIGVVKMFEPPEGVESVRLEKLVFSQCGMVAGPAIGCSVISTKGGPLVLCLHWQEGVVEEEFMEELKGFLEKRLLSSGCKTMRE